MPSLVLIFNPQFPTTFWLDERFQSSGCNCTLSLLLAAPVIPDPKHWLVVSPQHTNRLFQIYNKQYYMSCSNHCLHLMILIMARSGWISIEDPCCGANTALGSIPLGIFVFGCTCASVRRDVESHPGEWETVTVPGGIWSPRGNQSMPPHPSPTVTANHTQGPVCVIMVNDRD